MRLTLKLAIFWGVIVIVLSACTPNPEPPVVTDQPPGVTVGTPGYPGPQEQSPITLDGYPGPITDQGEQGPGLPAGPLSIPAAKSDMGVVHGYFVPEGSAGRAALAGDIYLAPVIYSSGAQALPFVSLDPNEDPIADARSAEQQFLFADVPPGEYGIVIHSPVSDYIVLDDSGGLLLITVQAGQVLDLGTITLE